LGDTGKLVSAIPRGKNSAVFECKLLQTVVERLKALGVVAFKKRAAAKDTGGVRGFQRCFDWEEFITPCFAHRDPIPEFLRGNFNPRIRNVFKLAIPSFGAGCNRGMFCKSLFECFPIALITSNAVNDLHHRTHIANR